MIRKYLKPYVPASSLRPITVADRSCRLLDTVCRLSVSDLRRDPSIELQGGGGGRGERE